MGIEEYMDTWPGQGLQYIPRLHVTEEYIPIYLSVRCN
jgi:hypothetical protein